ncbi:MAG: hypothetical protein IPJ19_13340 [Planctomycetes bacterium]|nr:hypothetical protein [Planctomycetota bacterium]
MLAATLALGLLVSSGGRDFPFQKTAETFLSEHGLSGKTVDELDLDAVLGGQFLSAPVGAFEVRYPIASLEKRSGELLKCARALLDGEEHLLDWLKPSGLDQKTAREDLKSVQKWIGTLKEGQLQRLKEAGGKDWMELLNCPDATKAAQKRLAEAFETGALFGGKHDAIGPVRLVLTPSRKDFVEFLCYAGWQFEEDRGLYWVEGLTQWTSAFVHEDQVITLEYSVAGAKPEDYAQGTAMADVMGEQVVQLAFNSLFEHLFGERAPSAFVTGLSMNLVIEQFNEVNTRVDGDTRGRQTGKREVFVAGGQSEGGQLGKTSADTRWRELQGSDHFLKILKLSQKEGAEADKKAKSKIAALGIRNDKGTEPKAIPAPFFGSAAGEKNVPDEYRGDFAESMRAYKSAFLYYLQTQAGGAGPKAREKFAQLLCKLADPATNADFEPLFPEIFDGALLSDTECSKNSLEGRFLAWLPSAR